MNVAVDWSGRKIGDQIKTADKNNVPYVMVLGEDEIKSKSYKIKNLVTGEERIVAEEEIPECVK
ncbi:MAG: His/Gly/Thr/Pro-type tRNA ligase C-terminal domain-containing protein [Minisyncoccota bacterium]